MPHQQGHIKDATYSGTQYRKHAAQQKCDNPAPYKKAVEQEGIEHIKRNDTGQHGKAGHHHHPVPENNRVPGQGFGIIDRGPE